MPYTALVVDDEPLAREGLLMLLSADAELSATYEAKNGREAIAQIRDKRPDLVFLDVQMPEMDGLSVLQELSAEEMPALVFVTAHDQYAIQAFEANAVDYLLKPVTENRFRQTLERIKQRLAAKGPAPENRQILSLLETVVAPRRYVRRLAVRSAGKTTFVELDDVEWIEAAENYVQLHAGRGEHLVHVAMNTLEKSLDPEMFLRIHRSAIVNVRRIRQLETAMHGEYVITLDNGLRLQSGRNYNARLRALTANPF